jgi:hypothetical protein
MGKKKILSDTEIFVNLEPPRNGRLRALFNCHFFVQLKKTCIGKISHCPEGRPIIMDLPDQELEDNRLPAARDTITGI